VFGHAARPRRPGGAATYWAIPNFPEDFSAQVRVTVYLDEQGNRLMSPEVPAGAAADRADGVDTTVWGLDSDGNGFLRHQCPPRRMPPPLPRSLLQAAGGPGSLSPNRLYRRLQEHCDSVTGAERPLRRGCGCGPGGVGARWRLDALEPLLHLLVARGTKQSIASITFNTTAAGLIFSANPEPLPHRGLERRSGRRHHPHNQRRRFELHANVRRRASSRRGVRSRSACRCSTPIEGSTQEDPDRFRGTTVTVRLSNGTSASGIVAAFPKTNPNRFTGAGLLSVNAAKAVQSED